MKIFFRSLFGICAGLTFLLPNLFAETPGGMIKPEPDWREYRTKFLDNQMKITLVSDPKTESSVASVNVSVGSYDDPEDVQGMAHFLEHMLFLGTEKYPDPGEYANFLETNGGRHNAFTGKNRTNYFFSVDSNKYEEALDRLSQFFIAPLFNEELVQRELNAINAEHSKNIQSDGRRFYQVLRSLSKADHPNFKFATGNHETLKNVPNLRDRLLRFYRERYSANLMHLVLVGREPLDQLEAMAEKYFGKVRNSNRAKVEYEWDYLDPKHLPGILKVKTLKDEKILSLLFTLPPYLAHYDEKPWVILGALIGDESEGSLHHFLTQKNLATSLSAGLSAGEDLSHFSVRIELTEAGLSQANQIVTEFFTYLKMVIDGGFEEWRYQEYAKLARIQFKFKENASPLSTAIDLSDTPEFIPFKDLLYYPYRYDSFNLELLKEIAGQITPEKVLVSVQAKDLETDRKERWYGTEFSLQSPSPETLAEWENALAGKRKNPELTLKKPNPFIPERVELLKNSKADEHPKLIHDENGIRFWLMRDDRFLQPESTLKVRMEIPLVYRSPANSASARLLSAIWEEALNPLVYPASEAGYSFDFGFSDFGMTLTLSGYNENLPFLLKRILRATQNTEVEKERFETMKTELLSSWQNIEKSSAGSVLFYEMQYLLNETRWHRSEYIQTIPGIDLNSVSRMAEVLFQNMEMELLLYGNADQELADEILGIFEKDLPFKPIFEGQKFNQRILDLENGKDFLLEQNLNDKDSAVIMLYASNHHDLREILVGSVLSDVIGTPFYEQLRTQEQLGYIVQSSSSDLDYLPAFFFFVQSPEKDPVYLQTRIRTFLGNFAEKLESLPQEVLNNVKQAMINKIKEGPKTSGEALGEAWGGILSKDYEFVSRERRIELLRSIGKEDLVRFFRSLMLDDDNSELAVMGWGSEFEKKEAKGIRINETVDFKRRSTFFGNFSLGDLLEAE